jgi:hypothetical protein
MYNIQNASGKNIALMLERGGFILRPGKYLDLDVHCSRPWITANFDVKRLIQTGAVRLVHDSNQSIPSIPIRPILRYINSTGASKVLSTKPVEIVDLSENPDVEVDDLGRVHKDEPVEDKGSDTLAPIASIEAILLEGVKEDEEEVKLVDVPIAKADSAAEEEQTYKPKKKKNKKNRHYYPSIDEDPVERQFKNVNK